MISKCENVPKFLRMNLFSFYCKKINTKKLNNKKRFWALSKLTIVLATKRFFVLEPKRKLNYTIRAPPERILKFYVNFQIQSGG